MIRSRLADLVLSLLLYHVHFATAQRWRQTFSTPAANGVAQTCWQPDAGSPCVPPVQTSKSFFLEYNCYYMENICQNARLWLAGHMVANQVRTEFAYDYKGSRRDNRRDESCPRTWINNGRCPERGMPGQARSYRWNRVTSTGEFWPTVDLAPGSNNLIADDATGRPSEMIYSCDEFPPATWIQGGLGANTRCAAFRCDGTPYSSEQQFQAISHGVLRSFMQGRVPRFDINTEVVIFFFRMTNANNEIPVSIGYTDGLNPGEEIASPFTGPSKKRGIEGAESIWNGNLTFDQWIDWGNSVTMDELRQNHGLIEHHILVNDTKNDPNFMLRRELGNDIFGRWTSEFDDARTFDAKIDFIGQNISFFAEQQANHVVPSQNSRRHQIIEHPVEKLLSSIHGRESTSTPLLLNVTESALQRAVRIVEQAISDATRLNAARFENVARNKYGLAPGTVIGASGGVKRRKRNGPKGVRDDQDSLSLPPPPPLLDVTADLAAAAALVAEADAAGITGLNVSRSLH
ncbi:uncharacterized protein K489DRAFT_414339 [Dissoconium aciculare CBS 342.82]|uniref:Uncharacterized protein n=1 Tax=Dissoconium aciculare CBS 342.82 TaxID=1314786 RepID=A0A6J3LQ04_9PEZI|nr:uncharacterized protein K489DRAFT_414339 [Dissoconium aciculare CBS 342.82]KAF1817733.1 hypothetical protein K489DRAFT_414339 [Dissoconium aciculare CBS 342.82]